MSGLWRRILIVGLTTLVLIASFAPVAFARNEGADAGGQTNKAPIVKPIK